jgi:hypothetical protein
MLSKVVFAYALAAALSAEFGVANDSPPLHQRSWPIYNGFDHQPTQDELRALHQQDVTPDQARQIDRLYDELLGPRPARAPRRLRWRDRASVLSGWFAVEIGAFE